MASSQADNCDEKESYESDHSRTTAAGNGSDSDVTDSFLLLSYLDEVEDRVQALKRHASALSQEKSSLLTVLSYLKDEIQISKAANGTRTGALTEGESEEMILNIEQLCQRCESVHIKVHCVRSKEQQCAFEKVDSMVKELELMTVLDSPHERNVHTKARTYLSACLSDSPGNSDAIDHKFQGMILDCALDDQKSIRHRLESLVQGQCHVDFLDDNADTLSNSRDVSQVHSESSHLDAISASNIGPKSITSNGSHSDLQSNTTDTSPS